MVQCFDGWIRSSSIVIAWLIKNKNITYKIAHKYVEEKRPLINPNKGFEALQKK